MNAPGPRLWHDILRPDLGGPDETPLVTFARDDRTFEKGELRERVERVAFGLRAAGVNRGDRVGVMLPNSVEYLELSLACSILSAVVVHLHTDLRGSMLARPLGLTGPVLIVAAASTLDEVLTAAPASSLVYGLGPASEDRDRVRPFAELVAADGAVRIEESETTPDLPVCIYSSSGTTGPAKGVTLSHTALYAMAETAQAVLGFSADDVAYTVTPFYHANALVFMFLAAAVAEARTVFAERFSVTRFWTDIARYQATCSSLVGSAAAMLAAQPPAEHDGGTLKVVAAVPRPRDAAEFEKRFGIVLTEFYGSTEANLPLGVPLGMRQAGTCGRLLDGWDVRLADPDDQEVPDGSDGQLLVRPLRPHTVSSGYWGEPERTVEMWQDLWIHTGDLMRRDGDGWFYFIDRLKDAIRVSGENVASADIEQAIGEVLPGADVAAFGVPSELGDQDIMVAVVAPDGATVSLDEVIAGCRVRLPYFAVPRYAEVLESLPRTPTNRVKKAELRARGVRSTTVDFGRPRRSGTRTTTGGDRG